MTKDATNPNDMCRPRKSTYCGHDRLVEDRGDSGKRGGPHWVLELSRVEGADISMDPIANQHRCRDEKHHQYRGGKIDATGIEGQLDRYDEQLRNRNERYANGSILKPPCSLRLPNTPT